MSTDFWTILSSVSITVQALVLFLAAVLGIRQLREASRARSLNGFLELSSELNDPGSREIRQFIYGGIGEPRSLTSQPREEVERTCAFFDRMGVLVVKRLIPEDVALSMYFDVVLRVWNRVRSFIDYERARRSGSKIYMLHFEQLAERCRKYHQRYHPRELLDYTFTVEASGNVDVSTFCPRCGCRLQIRPHDRRGGQACPRCGFTIYRSSKPCVAAIILRDRRVLLVQRKFDPYRGFWDIPGGFLEEGEHPTIGAKREAREETGLDIEPYEILGIYMDVYGQEGESTLNVCYMATILGGEPGAGSDAAGLGWFELCSLPHDIAFTWTREALNQVKRRFGEPGP